MQDSRPDGETCQHKSTGVGNLTNWCTDCGAIRQAVGTEWQAWRLPKREVAVRDAAVREQELREALEMIAKRATSGYEAVSIAIAALDRTTQEAGQQG